MVYRFQPISFWTTWTLGVVAFGREVFCKELKNGSHAHDSIGGAAMIAQAPTNRLGALSF
jgi:hypothetical protein